MLLLLLLYYYYYYCIIIINIVLLLILYYYYYYCIIIIIVLLLLLYYYYYYCIIIIVLLLLLLYYYYCIIVPFLCLQVIDWSCYISYIVSSCSSVVIVLIGWAGFVERVSLAGFIYSRIYTSGPRDNLIMDHLLLHKPRRFPDVRSLSPTNIYTTPPVVCVLLLLLDHRSEAGLFLVV